MNLKILFMILVYYAILSVFFLLGGSHFADYSHNIDLNETDLSTEEIDKGGLFSSGVSFGRFFSFVTVGIGLPSDTPSWFSIMFFMWQTVVLILSVGFIISSIWNG